MTPQITACPFCSTSRSLSIYQDPIIPGTCYWLHCSKCGFSGDTVDAYGRLHDIDDPRKALKHAINKGFFNGPNEEANPDMIDGYATNYPLRRRHVNKLWQDLTHALNDITPQMVGKTQIYGLWHGWKTQYRDRMRRYLGGGSRRDILRIMDSGGRFLPKTGFSAAFALSYQDLPGRICAIQFLGDNQKKTQYFRSSADAGRVEGGLAMLDAIEALEGTVYATGDPYVALRLHGRNFHDWNVPLKLVLYNESTHFTWQAVNADRIVFWSPSITIDDLAHARHVNNGYIACKPSETYLRDRLNRPANEIMGLLDSAAVPWREYVLHRMISNDVDELEARDFVNKLMLTDKERKEITDLCPRYLMPKLKSRFGEHVSQLTIPYKGQSIVSKNEGWYWRQPRKDDELLSDAKVIVHRELIDREEMIAYWEGVIVFTGKEVSFREEVSVIESNIKSWITKTLLKAGLGTPTFRSSGNDPIIYAARQFNEYAREEITRRIGVRETGEIVFPDFSIVGGAIEPKRMLITTDKTPCRIKMPAIHAARVTMQITDAYPTYAVLWSLFAANLVAEVYDEPKTPIVIAGEQGCFGREMMKAFAQETGMHRHSVNSLKAFKDVIKTDALKSSYPVFVETECEGCLSDYPTDSNLHVFVNATGVEAQALSIGGKWVAVNASKFDASGAKSLRPAPAFLYMADLQKRSFELTYNDYHEAVLDDFLNWFQVYMRQDMNEVREEAKGILRVFKMPGPDFMQLITRLCRLGKIGIEHALLEMIPRLKQNTVVIIDDQNDLVYVSRQSFVEAAKRLKLPKIDTGVVTADLAAKGLLKTCNVELDGWLVSKSTWEGSTGAYLG